MFVPVLNFQYCDRQSGFTLIEVVVFVAMLAILMSVAAPSFVTAIASNRTSSYANDFVSAVNYARGEAVARRAAVTMCTSANGTSCRLSNDTDKNNWQKGWIVTVLADDTVLLVGSAFAAQVTLSGTALISFDASGALSASGVQSFNLVNQKCINNGNRRVDVSPTGRVSINSVSCS